MGGAARGLTILLLALLSAAPAAAQPHVLGRCMVVSRVRHRDFTYVACTDGRVARVDDRGRPRAIWVTDGQPIGFTVLHSQLFVDLEREIRVPIAALPTIDDWSAIERGRVRWVDGRRVHVVMPPGAVEAGDRVELGLTRRSRGLDGYRDVPYTVGRVLSTDGPDATVEVGYGELVSEQMYARPTRRAPTESRVEPPRLRNLFTVELGGRATLGGRGRDFAAGAFGAFAIAYHAAFQLVIRSELSPLAFVDPDEAVHAFGTLGFETAALEISFGAGATSRSDERGLLFAFVERIRIGHEDGLHLMVTALQGSGRQWALDGLQARFRLPVAYGIWLEARGGGGAAGYGFGEAAIRLLAVGNGRRGSVFVTLAAGLNGLFADSDEYFGGHLGADAEIRF